MFVFSNHLIAPVQELAARFTLDVGSEMLFGACVHSLRSPLTLPENASSSHAKGERTKAEKFAHALEEALSLVVQRTRRSWLWPLQEFFKDATAEHMDVVDGYLDPIISAAVRKRQEYGSSSKDDGEDGISETLLEQMVKMTSGE